jgi:phosphotriesterase-related protein
MHSDSTMYPYDRTPVKTNALKILSDLKSAGISTVVDCTANDCIGRDPELFKELAVETGVNIICVTGLYFEGGGAPVYWKARLGRGGDISDEIYQMMKTEIANGIGKTGIKAGAIKVGTSRGTITDYEKQVLKAAARTQKETGVPIMTHTEGPTMGPEQADWLIANGANPKQIAIGHMNNSTDINYHLEVLERPDVYASFDRTGLGLHTTQVTTAKNISELIRRGYVNRILLSADSTWTSTGRPRKSSDEFRPFAVDWYAKFVAEGFRNLLKAEGVTEAQFNMLTIENPERLYSGK